MGLLTETKNDSAVADNQFADVGISTMFRCDQCGAQAYTVVAKEDLHLLLCGHHTKKYRNNLESQGWVVDDRTYLLTPAAPVEYDDDEDDDLDD